MIPACALLLASLLPADQPNAKVQLVEGKFGKALDASVTPLAFAGDERYRSPPLTVECWTKLHSKRSFNVLVSSDEKSSSRHWEIYSYAGKGVLSAYLPGYQPSEILSKKNICDGKWHHVAMTFDGKRVTLHVDGEQVHSQLVKPRSGLKQIDGPLSIGQAVEGSLRIGCEGLIDEVRLSRTLRKFDRLPNAVPAVDADTLAVWRFEDAETILADPAWTPPPATLGEPWERETDPDWVDARLRKMDTGPTFNATMSYPLDKQRLLVYKATAIRIGEKGEGGVLFDRNQLRLAAAWTGGWLNHSDRRFGLLNTPTPAGKLLLASPLASTTAPLPPEKGRFQGLFLHGNRVVISYHLQGVEVLESPWLENIHGQQVLTRTFEIGPSTKTLQLSLGPVLGVQVAAGFPATPLSLGANQAKDAELTLERSTQTRRFRVVYGSVDPSERARMLADLIKQVPIAQLRTWTKAGPPRWGKPLLTRGQLSSEKTPYVVDTLPVPYQNPYHALMFTSGFDFLPDGRLAVCTAHGDVWLVQADDKLENIQWQRFATGLYHPLGLKVIRGKIVVLERGQLTRLHDDNADGEADRYENLCHDWHTGAGEHSYDTCLETDPEGNFYFFKTGDTHLPHGGCLLKVNSQGKNVEVFATGFRHPIGLGVSPTGVVTGADQEGNWMPVTRVDIYKKGGFYGDMRAHHRHLPPKLYDGPLVWLPKDVDNSAGGQAWVPHDRFGLPQGQLLHLSYGRCKLYALLTQKIDDIEQAGAVDLGVQFLSGAMRARFHPTNGHLYVCGLRGWQTAAKQDGCLQRVRYTGLPLPFPVSLQVQTDGIRLGFAQKLAPACTEKSRFLVEQWNYRWTADYGSKRWSIRQPDRQGQDRLEIDSVTLADDGKSLFLKVKRLGPAMQMRIGYELLTAKNQLLRGAIHSTVHRLAINPDTAK